MVLLAMPRSSSFFQKLADLGVVLHHTVRIKAEFGLPLRLGLKPGPDVHTGRIEPGEERLLVAVRAVDEVKRGAEKFLVHCLHAFLGEWAGIGAALLAPLAETRILARRIGNGRRAAKDAARTETQLELSILRIVGVLGLVLGVQVVEIAKELVEAVNRRQKLIAVAEMVLTELSGHIALRLEQLGKRRVLLRQSFLRSRQAYFQKSSAQRTLAGDERGAAGSARLLAVIVGEDRAFVGDAVDVGRAVAHHAAVVGTDVPVANIIAHNHKDVGFLLLLGE